MIDIAFSQYILGRKDVNTFVGTRVYAEQAPQGAARPFITYRLAGGEHQHHSTGASTLANAEIDVTCAGQTFLEARRLYEALRLEVDGFQGEWGDNNIEINRATLSAPVSNSLAAIHADEVGHPAVRATLDVWFRQSVLTQEE